MQAGACLLQNGWPAGWVAQQRPVRYVGLDTRATSRGYKIVRPKAAGYKVVGHNEVKELDIVG